jgi:transcriptional regulator with XRE-family HTH domain
MNARRLLTEARKQAGLTQRGLAVRVGMPQSAIARIERGTVVPRVDTLDRMLAGCGRGLEVRPRLGLGLDRTGIRRLLALTPGQRARLAAREARNLRALLGDPG